MTGIVTIDKKDLNITMEIFPQIPQKKKKASVPVCHQIVIWYFHVQVFLEHRIETK